VLDRRRHAPLARPRLARLEPGAQGMSQVYRGRGRRTLSSVFEIDHADSRSSGRFRWMLSTCLAATVGAIAIGIVIFGSLDGSEASLDVPSVFARITKSTFTTNPAVMPRESDGPRWAVPRSDRMQPASGAPTVRQVIHEQIQVRRNGRPYNQIRPYLRIVTRLLPVPPRNFDVIPSFNPITLYGVQASEQDSTAAGGQRNNFRFQVLDLIGGSVPTDDGLDLDANEIAEAVALFEAEETLAQTQASAANGTGQSAANQSFSRALTEQAAANSTILARQRTQQAASAETLERHVPRVHTMQRGENLDRALRGAGGDPMQVRQMIAAMRSVFQESQVTAGLQLHLTMVPSLTRQGDEPARFSLFTEGGEHKVSVTRNASGEFEASAKPFTTAIVRAAMLENDTTQGASIYASLYNAALTMGVPPAIITQKLRVHAYDTDFRRQISAGDFAEFFFDMREEASGENTYGDLLFTAMATGGEIYRYWRYRTPDNQIDYYDENGNNSKKFLLRRPVRGENVRLASGFGLRHHPILNFLRPHNGIDWAAPIGTPILAAGNGVVEEARHRGEFGNHIRIRHSNGYQSTYSHMSRYAPRIQEGVNVRQGEVIGFVGNTGLSKGPHLHFEIHANQRPVDPLSIQVPRERQLTGKLLAEFQKERARIDELMRRQPVSTENK
jgi:murein DD-endopeptidase MepM/ murein hydrolase activator NlpD